MGAVHLDHLGVEVHLDAIVGGDDREGVGEHLDAKHAGGRQDQDEPAVVEDPLLAPGVGGEVGDLLGGAGALDRPHRLGEQGGATPLEAGDVARGVDGGGQEVVAGDVGGRHRLLHAGDAAEVELDAGADDEVVVGDVGAVGQRDDLVVGVDVLGVGLDPRDVLGHHRGLRPRGGAARRDARPDQRVERLVVVRLGRFDNRDIGLALEPQLGGDRDAGGPSAHDDDLVMLAGCHGWHRPSRWWLSPSRENGRTFQRDARYVGLPN